jgi:membrane protease YdiL (CAAX protease family)
MQPVEAGESILSICEAFLFLAAATAPTALILWYLFVKGRALFPRQRNRSVSWSGWEIGLSFFLCLLFWPIVIGPLASASFPTASEAHRLLAAQVFPFPFQIATVFYLCFRTGRGRLYQIGFDESDLPRRLLLGWLFWICATPIILALGAYVEWLYRELLNTSPEEHPLEKIAKEHLNGIDWVMVIALAMGVAPFLEEILFRGVLQAWATKRMRRGELLMHASLILVIFLRGGKLANAVSRQDWSELAIEAIPLVFVFLMLPATFIARFLFKGIKPEVVTSIFGTSMLFAMAHAFAWPTPIPLFFLALCLGYLAYRTQSIIPGILVHSLFNGVAVVTMMLSS